MNKKLIFGIVPFVLVIALFGITGGPNGCGYLNIFEKTVDPGELGSRIDSCLLCHINPNGGGVLNHFGTDFANNSHNFTKIEKLDSDGDGFTNIAEIHARSFPGNASDIPVTPTLNSTLYGVEFYASNCQSCHNTLTSSTMLGKTAAQIKIAINTVPAMSSLSVLSLAKIQDIATALASPTSTQTTTIDGTTLYSSNCAGCHRPLATSTKLGRTAAQIHNSISVVSSMGFLSSLSPEHIQEIATALSASQAPTPAMILDGTSLYAGNCAGCHNRLAATTKPGRTEDQIQNAINTVPGMSTLSSLSTEQISNIASALPPALPSIPPPALTTTLDGATLYDNFCASCHNALASTAKTGRTEDQITSAIRSVPGMSSLSTLSAEQIAAIAAILPPTTQTTPTNPTLDGAALYGGNCAGCHNPLASTKKPGRTATQIQNAINTVPGMSVISSLTPAQITAIAAVLPAAPASTTTLDGATLYGNDCSNCHGALASTNKPGRTATQIQNAINTVSAMSTVPSLTSAQIAAIAAVLPAAPASTTTLDGATLYGNDCSNCHGALASTNKPGRTATQIQNAINTVSAMSTVPSLTSAQITAIAAVLPAAPASTTTLDGATLYGNDCSSCHGALASTNKPGRTATQIQNAINTVSAMSSVPSLTSAQIAAIAAVLPAAPASTTTLDGATLYGNDCSSCHGALASTNKPGRTATQIQNAINTVSAMSSVPSLTSAQIAAIAAVLPAMPTDGASLYASYCSSCHGALATSQVGGASSSTITSRISSVQNMNYLSILSSAQIQAIANALQGIRPTGD